MISLKHENRPLLLQGKGPQRSSILQFLHSDTTDIWGRTILCLCVWWGGCVRGDCCPVHCRIFHSIPSLYPLDARSTPYRYNNQNASRHCQTSPGGGGRGGQNAPSLPHPPRTTELEASCSGTRAVMATDLAFIVMPSLGFYTL